MKGADNATLRTTLFGFLVCLLVNICTCGPSVCRNTHMCDLDCAATLPFALVAIHLYLKTESQFSALSFGNA